jgi:hypothetical protein
MPRAEIASKQALYTLTQLRRIGGQVCGEQERWRQNQNGHDASRSRVADAKAGLRRPDHLREAPQQEQPMVQAERLRAGN